MTQLDHLVVAAETLEQGLEYVEHTLGVTLPPAGGQHPLMGTHNRLLNLGHGAYLEIIAIDPAASPPPHPRWFELDRFTGAPRLLTWVARTDDLEGVASLELGTVSKASRGDLEWLIAIPEDGRLHLGGTVPYLIQWGQRHPTDTLPDAGCYLTELVVFHPQPERVRSMLGAINLELLSIRLERSPRPELWALIQTPHGCRLLR